MRFPCLIIGILAVLLILVLLWACRVAGPAFYIGNVLNDTLEPKVAGESGPSGLNSMANVFNTLQPLP